MSAPASTDGTDRQAVRRWALRITVFGLGPLVAYGGLLESIERTGGTTVMLGATAGSAWLALAATGIAIAVRLYLMLLLPAVTAYLLTLKLFEAAHLGTPRGPQSAQV